jgi:hypothetical protein
MRVKTVNDGRELVEEAQVILRDAAIEIEDSEIARIVRNAEEQLDEALYMLEYDEENSRKPTEGGD